MKHDIKKDILIKKLCSELREDNLAIFAGAGLSIPAGFVDWATLLEPIAEGLALDINKETDLVSLAQYHCNMNGSNRSELTQLLINDFCEDKEGTENHKILARLPISTYWTTNYDKLIENSLKDVKKIADVKYKKEQLQTTKPKRDAIVYKMHGDVDHSHEAVLTKDDYEKYHIKMDTFINALQGDLISKTFLFLGFSFSDPNLDYILSRVRVAYGDHQRPHYCILKNIQRPNCVDDADFEYRKRKQEFFIQDLGRFSIKFCMIDNYQEITEILADIEKKYRRHNVFISGAAHEYGKHTSEDVHRFVFNLSQKLIEEDFNIVSGFGLGIGSSVISGVISKIYMKGGTLKDDRLLLRPFPQDPSGQLNIKELWTPYRKDMLSYAGIAIFIYGNKLENDEITLSNGVEEEFDIAHEKSLFLLPIGATGYMAKTLWDKVKNNFDHYNPNCASEVKNIFLELGNDDLSFEQIIEKTIQILKKIK
jgi:hypothetical protein